MRVKDIFNNQIVTVHAYTSPNSCQIIFKCLHHFCILKHPQADIRKPYKSHLESIIKSNSGSNLAAILPNSGTKKMHKARTGNPIRTTANFKNSVSGFLKSTSYKYCLVDATILFIDLQYICIDYYKNFVVNE